MDVDANGSEIFHTSNGEHLVLKPLQQMFSLHRGAVPEAVCPIKKIMVYKFSRK